MAALGLVVANQAAGPRLDQDQPELWRPCPCGCSPNACGWTRPLEEIGAQNCF